MGNVMVYAEHLQGRITDATYELLALGRRLAASSGGEVEAVLLGDGVASLASELGGADVVLVGESARLSGFDPEGHARALAGVVEARGPSIVLLPYTSTGMDLAGDVASATGLPLVSYCQDIRVEGPMTATCQLYAGKVLAEVAVDGNRAVFAVLSGAAPADEGRNGGAGRVETIAVDESLASRVTFVELHEPEGGDVDITAEEVLVAVGRGVESEDNLEEIEELAEALGAAVAASRPVVDQGWLPKSRQVGKSGLTVKPKVYLALGISGAPEHVEGIRDAGTIIAVNTDPQAPIFGVAHYGWVGDLFDLVPELVDKLEG